MAEVRASRGKKRRFPVMIVFRGKNVVFKWCNSRAAAVRELINARKISEGEPWIAPPKALEGYPAEFSTYRRLDD